MFGTTVRRSASIAGRTSGSAVRRWRSDPAGQRDRRRGQAAEDGRGRPAPGVALRDREQEQHQAGAQHEGAPPVDPPRAGRRPLRQDERAQRQGQQGDGEADPERPAVVGAVAGEQAGADQADDAAHAQHAADHRHGHVQPRGRELAAEHADRQGEQPVRGALQDPAQRAAAAGTSRAGSSSVPSGDDDQDAEDHRPLAPEVAQPAQHRGEHGGGEQVGGQHPAGRAGGDVQLRGDDAEDRARRGICSRDSVVTPSASVGDQQRRAGRASPALPGTSADQITSARVLK